MNKLKIMLSISVLSITLAGCSYLPPMLGGKSSALDKLGDLCDSSYKEVVETLGSKAKEICGE